MMRTLTIAILLAAVPATAAERLTDRDVKKLIERLYEERDQFEGRLDGTLKRATLKSPQGDLVVARVLDDLQENVAKFRDRFTPGYSAGPDLMTVIRQAAVIDRYLSSQAPGLQGQAEWQRVTSTLGAIAAAYATTFPPPSDQATARRHNDPEVKKAAEQIAAGADRLKSALDTAFKTNKSMDKATREAALKDLESLKIAARTLAARVGDQQPASADAAAVLNRMAAAETVVARAPAPTAPTVQSAVDWLRANVMTIAQAFAITPGGTD